jgi:pyruvate ferredoxin oxidoreductase beta subunit
VKVAREFFRNLKALPLDERLAPGSALCAGCGALTTLRLVLKVLGENVVAVNAAGCLTLLAVYPFTPLRTSWLYTTMGSASAGAQGLRDALDLLIQHGRLSKSDDLRVLVLAGDGATLDIGLSSLSGAIHRGLDFFYLCYDNEAYGNTGFQMSSASPFGSQTATSRPGEGRAAGTLQQKKDLFALWLAQRPPYIATVSAAEPVDLAEKVRRADRFHGPKLFHALSACPPGWGHDPSQSHHIAQLALDTGVWPLKEAVCGTVRHTYIPERRSPLEDILRSQRRYQHLFSPTRQEDVLAAIQAGIDAYWADVALREGRAADRIRTASEKNAE